MLIKQILGTMAIVGCIYAALLFVNHDLIAEERVTWQDYERYTNELYASAKSAVQTKGKSTENSKQTLAKAEVQDPVQETQTDTEQASSSPYFDGVTLDGIVETVELSNADQVMRAWSVFQNEQGLHNRQDWSSGKQTVFAYYHAMNADFSGGKLAIGYKNSAGSLKIPGGESRSFKTDSTTSTVENAAWEYAYPDGVVVEEYEIASDGNYKIIRAFVVKPSASSEG